MTALQGRFEVSERRACAVVDQLRSTQRYEAKTKTDEPALCRRLREIVRQRPRFGYRRLTAVLKRDGWSVNVKRVHRLCRKEGLKVRRNRRKLRAIGIPANACYIRRAGRINDVRTWDFVFDRTRSGSALKWLSIVDEFTREYLALKMDQGITSEDVIDTLPELFSMRGVPTSIRSDNGPEFVATAIRDWLAKVGVGTLYIETGSLWRNGYAESFHSRFRDEFENVAEARRLTSAWKEDYNHHRPHGSLGYTTPAEFATLQCRFRSGADSGCASAPPPLQRH